MYLVEARDLNLTTCYIILSMCKANLQKNGKNRKLDGDLTVENGVVQQYLGLCLEVYRSSLSKNSRSSLAIFSPSSVFT